MVATISGAPSAAQPDPTLSVQQIRNDWTALSNALQSGDLTAARDAFSKLAANRPEGQAQPQSSQISADFNALGQALQSGDLSAGQKAFATLQSDFQALRAKRAGGGGHKHGGGGDSDEASGTASSSGNSTSKTIVNEQTVNNADGTITVTTTYTDGSTSTATRQNPNPAPQTTLAGGNAGQFLALLTAQEQSQKS